MNWKPSFHIMIRVQPALATGNTKQALVLKKPAGSLSFQRKEWVHCGSEYKPIANSLIWIAGECLGS